MKVKKVTDREFAKYGKIVEGIDFSDFHKVMEKISCPQDTEYVASYQPLEDLPYHNEVRDTCFGELSIEIGYCVGHNDTLNALEYHRSSEINIAVMDMILLLGFQGDITKEYTYNTEQMEAFLVPAGTAVELYATTLHYAPFGLPENNGAFKSGVILPYGTNFDSLKVRTKHNKEDELFYAKNKWLIAHPEGGEEKAYIGLEGKNLSIKDLEL